MQEELLKEILAELKKRQYSSRVIFLKGGKK